MDAKAREYYTLCADFLKLSEVYRRVISEVSDVSSRSTLPSNFQNLDFSKDEHIYSWWSWLKQNEAMFPPEMFQEYGDLLYLVYPVFQDVHSQPIDLVLFRIELAQMSKQLIIHEHISDGKCYIKEKMNLFLKEYEKISPDASASDFVESFQRWMDRDPSDVVDLKSDVVSEFDDDFCYIAKIDVRGERNDVINEFRKYQSKKNYVVDKLYRNWDRYKRIRAFAHRPVEVKNLEAKRKMLNILRDKQEGMAYRDINVKYALGSLVANSAKEYVKRAKKIIRIIELKGEFMLNGS